MRTRGKSSVTATPLVLDMVAGGDGGVALFDSPPPQPLHMPGMASCHPGTKPVATSTNKPLSSRFRGVCWNKKNKRWQAAINSAGKYLYLGSNVSEDEAARAFDRAAMKVRGRKARLNFSYDDYVDENGNLIDDVQLPTPSAGSGRSGNGKIAGVAGITASTTVAAALEGAGGSQQYAAPPSGSQHYVPPPSSSQHYVPPPSSSQQYAAALPRGVGGGAGAAQQLLDALTAPQAAMLAGSGGGGMLPHAPPLVGAPTTKKEPSIGELRAQLLPSCQLELMFPGEGSLCGVVWTDTHSGCKGAGVWTGAMLQHVGSYTCEEEAKAASLNGMHLLAAALQPSNGLAGLSSMGVAEAAAAAMAAAQAGDFGLASMMGSGSGGSGRLADMPPPPLGLLHPSGGSGAVMGVPVDAMAPQRAPKRGAPVHDFGGDELLAKRLRAAMAPAAASRDPRMMQSLVPPHGAALGVPAAGEAAAAGGAAGGLGTLQKLSQYSLADLLQLAAAEKPSAAAAAAATAGIM